MYEKIVSRCDVLCDVLESVVHQVMLLLCHIQRNGNKYLLPRKFIEESFLNLLLVLWKVREAEEAASSFRFTNMLVDYSNCWCNLSWKIHLAHPLSGLDTKMCIYGTDVCSI